MSVIRPPDAPSHAPRPLGKGGLVASPMAWGMWRFHGEDLAGAQAKVEAALESGFTLLDTADIYGTDEGGFGTSEALLGKVLTGAPGLRGRMTLASKGGIVPGLPYDSSAAYLERACEASLTRLRVERIDLYQIHRPDSLAHPAEVAGALERLRAAGKIAEAGVSNHTPGQVRALAAHLPFPLASIQPEFSALAIAPLSDGVLDQAMETGMAVLAWSPLGGGRLAGSATEGRVANVVAALAPVAERHGVSVGVAAYAWIMAHPARPVPIVGTQDVGRIREAAQALTVGFTRAEWYAVLTASRGEKLP